ncbi:MAG: GNAT family N-acetyltransferase [Nitrospira sp.]|nr:GNAT family N-acetyltransferase [Nitrospira sp.]
MGKLNTDASTPKLTAPEALNTHHILADFDCGHDALNDWLKHRALKNEASGASRTYVVCHRSHVVAYYTLATGAVQCAHAPGRVRRNMPDPIPVMVLGRLAVHVDWQKKGLGRDLLADTVRRTLQAAAIAGIRAFVVHALSDEAKRFYERFGFQSSPTDPMDLMIPVKDARTHLP